jgi:demethylmenaquinone methyltransferase / 2-methoxy-6-polyprenyl-1,4-benzoquinol methylase
LNGSITTSKKEKLRSIFDSISYRYDFLDHLMSLGVDRSWRRKTVSLISSFKPKKILDVATGTADLAIATAAIPGLESIIGVDISQGMLDFGKKKVLEKKLDKLINLSWADAENLPFESNTFDVVSVAFGVRNFENINQGLSEIFRVLKPDGHLVVLEFSIPRNLLIRMLYMLYFNTLVPIFGSVFAKNRHAYEYLTWSVNRFPYGVEFNRLLEQAEFKEINFKPLSSGICTLYSGKK